MDFGRGGYAEGHALKPSIALDFKVVSLAFCANRERAQSGDLLPLTSGAAVWDSAARRPLSRTSSNLMARVRRQADFSSEAAVS